MTKTRNIDARVQEEVRAITLGALTRAKLDRRAVHKVSRELLATVRAAGKMKKLSRKDLAKARSDLRDLQKILLGTLRDAARAGSGTAAASGVMLARVAAGVLAGIADTASRSAARRR